MEKILSEIENILSKINKEGTTEISSIITQFEYLDNLLNLDEKRNNSYDKIQDKIDKAYLFLKSIQKDTIETNVLQVLLRDIYSLILTTTSDQNKVDEFDTIDITAKIIDEIPYLIFWKDINGRYRGCNNALVHIAGFDSAKDIVGYNDTQMPWKPTEMLDYMLDDQYIINSGEARINFEETNKQANGEETYGVTSKVPLKNENGDVIGLLGIFQDITEKKKTEIALVQAHKNIKDSINYASLIQQAIVPSKEIMQNYTKDSFIFWQPRDVVGGDIYFIEELESKEEILIMVIDGAGHGVSGAFVTMLVKAIETQIVAKIKEGTLKPNPSEILEYFNVSIKTMLKQEKGSNSNVGFDGGILYYNKKTKECSFAGAKTDLYIIDNNKLTIINGDKKNVGFIRTKIDQKYTQHKVTLQENTKLYISTDGIFDQEGENKTRYGFDRFENLLVEISNHSFEEQSKLIIESFNAFKKDINQTDDVTVVGLNFR